MGAQIVTFGPADLQLNTGETIEDTGQVLSRMIDALVMRTAGDPAELIAIAQQQRMAVINAMTADEHPTQALADLATMAGHFGAVEGLRVLYVGEGNNTAVALALALARFHGAALDLRTPLGYGLDAAKLARAQDFAEHRGGRVHERHDMDELPSEVDVVYTTRWQTTGTTKSDPNWRQSFQPFAVSTALMERYPSAVFMHDLPAHRGEEVDAAVLDGPDSLAFGQAENKLHSAMAVLEWAISGRAR